MSERQDLVEGVHDAGWLTAAQRRMVLTLSISTILGGLGIGAAFSTGALLVAEVTGNPALSGLAATLNAVGATIAGIPLARFAMRRGRRVALALGNLIAMIGAALVILASVMGSAPLLFVGLTAFGLGSATQLQARFAAADLAMPVHRARDLSLVVWSITIGAVVGPNLAGPGERVGTALGIPELSGVFVFAVAAQLAAIAVVWIGLRPDPLLTARDLDAARGAAESGSGRPMRAERFAPLRAQAFVIVLIASAHAVMVSIMAMTPLHIVEHGGTITLVGLTISLHIAGMYALSPVFGILTQRLGAPPVIGGGLGLLAAAAGCTGFGGASHLIIQVGLILLGLGWGAVTVAGAALLTTITPPDVRPKRQGQSDTWMNAAGATAGALSGLVFAVGGFPVLSVVAAMLIVAAALVLGLLVPLLRRAA